jgi:hypothetical protein
MVIPREDRACRRWAGRRRHHDNCANLRYPYRPGCAGCRSATGRPRPYHRRYQRACSVTRCDRAHGRYRSQRAARRICSGGSRPRESKDASVRAGREQGRSREFARRIHTAATSRRILTSSNTRSTDIRAVDCARHAELRQQGRLLPPADRASNSSDPSRHHQAYRRLHPPSAVPGDGGA